MLFNNHVLAQYFQTSRFIIHAIHQAKSNKTTKVWNDNMHVDTQNKIYAEDEIKDTSRLMLVVRHDIIFVTKY